MTRKLLSIAALAAITATSVSAFDTDMNGRLLKQEGTKRIVGNYEFDAVNNLAATADLTANLAGLPGDALVYPAFFSDRGWETEFSVINTGNEAMVAKVVFYSRENSKELKDFNIYLSGHDVFRATIKENKLIIADDSFVYQAKTPERKIDLDYDYTDTARQTSKSNIKSTELPEGAGYFVVYGMIQADDETSVNVNINGEDITSYHKNHDHLWRDYRHLVDECRGPDWRGGIQEGIYDKAGLKTPNVNLSKALCGQIESTIRNSKKDIIKFKSPEAQLIGSVTLKGDDSHGTRVMSLNAVPLTNFTDENQGLLWTEGEFASIADRDIVAATGRAAAQKDNAMYNGVQILADSKAFDNAGGSYTYEYGSSTESAFVLTQPHKRTLVQLVDDKLAGSATAADNRCEGDSGVKLVDLAWSGIKRANSGQTRCLITNYGAFDVHRDLYDDNENLQTAAAGGFTFSPATVTAETNTAPGEVTMISNLVSDDDRADGFTSGYATIAIPVPGIATHMRATDVGGNVETSWIYSGSVQ